MSFQYTEGPWQNIPGEKLGIKNPSKRIILGGEYIAEGEPDTIIEVVAGDDLKGNARLVANAPEMYEALAELSRTGALTRLPHDLDGMVTRVLNKVESGA